MSLLGIYVRFKQKNKYVPKKKIVYFFSFSTQKTKPLCKNEQN